MWFIHLTGFWITRAPIHYSELSGGQSSNVGRALLAPDKSSHSSYTVVFLSFPVGKLLEESRSLIVCHLISSKDQFQTWLYLIWSGKIFSATMGSLVKLLSPAIIFKNHSTIKGLIWPHLCWPQLISQSQGFCGLTPLLKPPSCAS